MLEDNIFAVIASAITGISTFFIGRKRAKKELEGMSINNIERSISVYQLLIDDLRGQVKELLAKVDELEDKVDELREENQILKDMLEEHDKRRNIKD